VRTNNDVEGWHHPDQQESTETKLADVHSHRTTAQGSQITTDSTQDDHRGKTSTVVCCRYLNKDKVMVQISFV
jgi:hypothetical protein